MAVRAIGRFGFGAGIALALASAAGCAAAAPAKPAVTREVTLDPPRCTGAPAPDPDRECGGAIEPPDGAPPSCVPAFARGHELARDDHLHMAVYEACASENRYATRNRVRVDPRAVMVERTGDRPASQTELDVIAGRLGLDMSTREPELAFGPQVAGCRPDRWQESERCLRLHLVARQPALPPLMTALAKLMPLEAVCVPMRVDVGVVEGCPPEDYRWPEGPVSQAR